MAIVTEDIIVGSGSEWGDQGRKDVRSFFIEELTYGISDATKAGFYTEVYNELAAQSNVFYSSIHPFDGTQACNRITPTPFGNSKTQARALAYYIPVTLFPSGSGNVIRWRSWSERRPTSRYVDKSLILVDYTPPGGTKRTVVGRLDGWKSRGELIIEREVTSDPEGDIVMQGKLNGVPYRGQDKWTFLCMGVQIDPIGASRWREVITLSYDEDTWLSPAWYVDKTTGEPPIDVVGGVDADGNVIAGSYDPTVYTGNGYTIPLVTGEADFASFGL